MPISIALSIAGIWQVAENKTTASAFFAPGPLHQDHQYIKKCADCHLAWSTLSNKSCNAADCHSPNDFKKSKNKVLEASHRFFKEKQCLDCHTEHKGVLASITKRFDHQILDKKTTEKWCKTCHQSEALANHTTMTNKKCHDCHENNRLWDSDFSHKDVKRLITENNGLIEVRTYMCKNCHPEDKIHVPKNEKHCGSCHKGKRGFQLIVEEPS